MFVWYDVWLIVLTSLNDCISFHLGELLNSHGRLAVQLRPPLHQEPDKCKIETPLKYFFIFICEVILCTKSLDKKMICFF